MVVGAVSDLVVLDVMQTYGPRSDPQGAVLSWRTARTNTPGVLGSERPDLGWHQVNQQKGTKTMSNTPVDTLRDGAIKATIWARAGEKRPFHSVEISRTYTDDQGKYHDAHSFTGTQLLRVARLAQRAYDRVRELESEQKREAA